MWVNGGRLFVIANARKHVSVSIHAPHMGCDAISNLCFSLSSISIHAAHMGSDYIVGAGSPTANDFNPRCPHGQRQYKLTLIFCIILFQSTLPTWAATPKSSGLSRSLPFQSTLPTWAATSYGRGYS